MKKWPGIRELKYSSRSANASLKNTEIELLGPALSDPVRWLVTSPCHRSLNTVLKTRKREQKTESVCTVSPTEISKKELTQSGNNKNDVFRAFFHLRQHSRHASPYYFQVIFVHYFRHIIFVRKSGTSASALSRQTIAPDPPAPVQTHQINPHPATQQTAPGAHPATETATHYLQAK